MGRQPITLLKFRYQNLRTGPWAFDKRPELAALVMQCIAYWSEIDLTRAAILGTLIKGDIDEAIAIYQALEGDSPKKAVLRAAATKALSTDDLALYDAVIKSLKPIETERNDFAHGLWGWSDDFSDGLLWFQSSDRLKSDIVSNYKLSKGATLLSAAEAWDAKKIFLYRKDDLVRSVENFFMGYGSIVALLRVFHMEQGPARAKLQRQLSQKYQNQKSS